MAEGVVGRTLWRQLPDYMLGIVLMAEVEGIRLVVLMAVRIHLALAASAAAVVSGIGVVQHATTWCERGPD